MLYIFIFIALRASRFDPKYFLATSVVAVTGRIVLIAYVIFLLRIQNHLNCFRELGLLAISARKKTEKRYNFIDLAIVASIIFRICLNSLLVEMVGGTALIYRLELIDL